MKRTSVLRKMHIWERYFRERLLIRKYNFTQSWSWHFVIQTSLIWNWIRLANGRLEVFGIISTRFQLQTAEAASHLFRESESLGGRCFEEATRRWLSLLKDTLWAAVNFRKYYFAVNLETAEFLINRGNKNGPF